MFQEEYQLFFHITDIHNISINESHKQLFQSY